jgi:EAL domain-containing protein (putative c-di-GMP-specific phosphodiesterase class I)
MDLTGPTRPASFGIRTVAEGVEDAETLELMTDLAVDEAQGYFLGRPGPSEDLDPGTRGPAQT